MTVAERASGDIRPRVGRQRGLWYPHERLRPAQNAEAGAAIAAVAVAVSVLAGLAKPSIVRAAWAGREAGKLR